jgi:hypothetical protein
LRGLAPSRPGLFTYDPRGGGGVAGVAG